MPTIHITDDDLYLARVWLAADQCLSSAAGPHVRDELESRRDAPAKTLARNLAARIVAAVDEPADGRVMFNGRHAGYTHGSAPIEQACPDEVAARRRAQGSLEREHGAGTGQVLASRPLTPNQARRMSCPRCFHLPALPGETDPCVVCGGQGRIGTR